MGTCTALASAGDSGSIYLRWVYRDAYFEIELDPDDVVHAAHYDFEMPLYAFDKGVVDHWYNAWHRE